ncbi:porin [Comamonas sp. F1-6]|uniref:porin n=1 Tax=Comamonas sp. F1-6 TaxID=673550 RepID=UPI0031E48CD5
MKCNHIVALSLATVAASASAQSSVTMFGILDVNTRYVNNSNLPSNLTMNNSGLSSGRLGFRGVEDLGGGLKAGFWLESDVNADTGTFSSTGKFFQRRSTVSLMGNFGEIRLGRDFSPASQNATKYDPFNVIGLAGSNITSRMPGTFASYYRHDNAIQYFSPKLAGFQAEAMYVLDENPQSSVGRHMAGRLAYDNGPLSLSVSYGTTNVNTSGAKLNQYGVAASYNFGVATLMGYFQRDNLPYGTYGSRVSGSEDRWQIGVTVPVGKDYIRASYVRTDSRSGPVDYNQSDANKFAIGYVHNMSTRTAVYGTVARITNKGGANFSLAGGAPGLAGGGNSTGAEVGIRHTF